MCIYRNKNLLRVGAPATCIGLRFYVQDTFIQELEEIHESFQEDELVIEGEYATEEKMVEWGWSELSVCILRPGSR